MYVHKLHPKIYQIDKPFTIKPDMETQVIHGAVIYVTNIHSAM